jgi:MSHA biogenesis protein MshI
MRFFKKTKKTSGWMAISLQPDGIRTAHVRQVSSERPVVEFIGFYAIGKGSIATVLDKLGNDFRARNVQYTTLLAAGDYQMLLVDAPNVPQDELKSAIRWRLKDMLDYHVNDATIDVLDIPVDRNAPVRNHSVYVVAARNQIIEQRQNLFDTARIPLRVIDIPDMAQRNISALLESEERGLAMLSFDNDGGLLTVTCAEALYLSRRIDVTLAQLSQDDARQKTIFHERITLELQRSLDHFDRQYHFITISKLLLAPLGKTTSGLLEYLVANLYMPVEPLDLNTIFNLSKVEALTLPENQHDYFMMLGAALRQDESMT